LRLCEVIQVPHLSFRSPGLFRRGDWRLLHLSYTGPPSTTRASRRLPTLRTTLACFAILVPWIASASAFGQVPSSTPAIVQPNAQPNAQSGPPATTASATADTDLDELPVESRQWPELEELDSAANVSASAARTSGSDSEEDTAGPNDAGQPSASDGSPATGLSYVGLAPIEDAQTQDGLSANQSFRSGPRGAAGGGPSSGASFAQSAIQSVRTFPRNFSAQSFTAQSYSAQHGGGAGGLTALLSRSAGDRLHGSLFFLERSSALAATNPYSVATSYNNGVVASSAVKPAGSQEQIGGTIALPFTARFVPAHLRRRVSVFASLELQLHDDHIVCTPELASFFALTTEQRALLGNRGVGSAAVNAALNYLDSLTGTVARSALRTLGFGRVDLSPSARDHIFLTTTDNRFDAPSGAALGQASDAVTARGTGSLGDSHVSVDAVAATWTHSFSTRWNNDLRGQFAHDLEYDTAHLPLPQEPGIGPGGYAPQVSIAPNGFSYGTPSTLGRSAYPDEHRIEAADTLQILLGRHQLALGGDWSRIDDRADSINAPDGAFSYDSGVVNGHDGGLVDWITDYTFNVHAYPNGGCPGITATAHYFCFRSFTQSFGQAQTEFVTHDIAGFLEDSFRARPNLTITLGLRYDYTLLPLPQAPNLLLDASLAALRLPNGDALPNGGSTSVFPEDRNNVAPRLAIAWSPGRRHKPLFTAHLGYGIFFGRIPGATIRAALTDTALTNVAALPAADTTLPPSSLTIRIRPTTEALCPQVTAVQQGFGYPCAYTSTPPAAVTQTTSATFFASHYRVPAVQRATFLLERELARGVELRATYAMAVATQLPNSVDLNISPAANVGTFVLQGGDGHPGLHTGETFVVPVYTARPIAGYGAVTALVSNANSTYHAGTVELSLRRFRPFELRAGYTFSRAIDYAPLSSARPGLDNQFDPFHIGYDKGLSNQQFPERFSGDLLYQVRLSHGPRPLQYALNGWRTAAIARAGSGAPYSYTVFAESYLSGGRSSLNGSGGARYLPTVGRNTLRLAPHGNLDLRVSREFTLHAPRSSAGGRSTGMHVNVFAQAFNLLNARNLSSVQTRAFLIGTPATTIGSPSPVGLPIPLIFQDAATVASEGLPNLPFGAPSSSTTGASRERQVELGFNLQF
jgi:hypothetical protein